MQMTADTNRKKTMLITGVSGMLGSNLAYCFRDGYTVIGLYNQNEIMIDRVETIQCDLAKKESVEELFRMYCPDIIVHCASLTDVDYCENNKRKTYEANVTATENLVKESKNKKFIYISTDSVYEGKKGGYFEFETADNQMNYYGVTKYEAETTVNEMVDAPLILRTNIFGWNYQNKQSIGEWIVENLKLEKKIDGFNDTFFSSIYTMEFGRILKIAIQRDISGTYNCVSSNSLSKYEFAVKLAKKFKLNSFLIRSVSIDDHQFVAKRGKKLSLNIEKIEKKLDYEIPDIEYSIDQFYRDYQSGIPQQIKQIDLDNKKNLDLIPYGRQWLDYFDINSVVDVLKSNLITQGPKVEEFETVLGEYCNSDYVTVVNSGTSALHIACLAAGIKPEDQVVTSPITFVASANCVAYCGGRPVFSDIDRKTYNLSPECLEKSINSLTKAVIPVHFAGQSCDMETILDIVKKAEKKYGHKIFIIEDACHALGSRYNGEMVGSSVYSDMTILSFHPVKHITTGEGGAVLTNDKKLNDKLKIFRSHGIVNSLDKISDVESAYDQTSDKKRINAWYYEQISLGYNYRMTDIQSVLGISQIKKLKVFVEKRRGVVEQYNKSFENIANIQIPYELNICESNFHLYVLLFDFEKIGISRAEYMFKLKEKGVGTQVHYIPVHTQPYYKRHLGTSWGDFPVAETYYSRCLSLPLFPKMTQDNIQKVIDVIISSVNVPDVN